MSIARKVVMAVVMAMLVFGATQTPAPASASASTATVMAAKAPPTKICKDPRFNWRLKEKVTYGGYVTKSYYSSSHDAACLKVRKKDSARSNYLLKVIRNLKDGKKKVNKIQLLDRVTAVKAFGPVGRSTDVEVYAAPVPETSVSYRGKFRLLF